MPKPAPPKPAGGSKTVSEFPVDRSTTGKHYEVAVPDYRPGVEPKQSSYFRLGVPHSSASVYDGEWSKNGDTTALGDDLLCAASPPDGFDSAAGGVRDHTDGNRLITTRLDHIEVIQGQYRQLVLSNQAWEGEDQDWAAPSDGNDEDASTVEHIYTSWYYEVLSSAQQPAPGSFAEPRKKVDEAKAAGYDFYEYVNAKNLVEISAGEESIIDKLYAGYLYEVVSTVHADHPDWETTDWGGPRATAPEAGDLVDVLFAKNMTEVVRAEDLLVDKLYADRLLEVISTWDINEPAMEKDASTLASGDVYEYLNAKHDLVEIMRAQNEFREEIYAKNIVEYVVADENLVERLEAKGSIDELTTAGGGINELTIAGGEVVDAVVAGGMQLAMFGAGGAIVEIVAGLLNVLVVGGAMSLEVVAAPVLLEVAWGTSTEFAVEHFSLVNETAEVAETKQSLINWQAQVGMNFMQVLESSLTFADVISLA